MARCISLAQGSVGICEPNPPVGAILFKDGSVIGSGRTQPCGQAHAEVMALSDARNAGHDPVGATMYVTLEPCSHFGRTPPCADAIIDAGISRVVVGIEDPFPEVSGKGIEKLRAAGIEVTVGVMAAEIRRLLGAYLKGLRLRRPWVVCKWAQTLDGRLATRSGHSKWISSPESRARVHELRAQCDGILVGINTVLADDPLLTTRLTRTTRDISTTRDTSLTNNRNDTQNSRVLTRIVLDSGLRISPDSQLLRTVGQSPVLVVGSRAAVESDIEKVKALQSCGAEVLALGSSSNGRLDLPELLDALGERAWTRLLVEGGGAILGSFISGGLADELNVYIATKLLGDPSGRAVSFPEAVETMDKSLQLPRPEIENIGDDLLLRYVLNEYE